MALSPLSSGLQIEDRGFFSNLNRALRGLFQPLRFAPEQVLSESEEIDPRLKPRVPMNSERIDPSLMMQFRQMGLLHAQEITADTHPELYLGWEELCRRAGYAKPLQLIVADNKDPNAFTASTSEVVVSTGLMKMLSLREMLAVLGHELGHVKHDPKGNNQSGYGIVGIGIGWIAGEGISRVHEQAVYSAAEQSGKPLHWYSHVGLFLSNTVLIAASALTGWLVSKQFSVKPSELRADQEGLLISGDAEAMISAFQKMKAQQDKIPAFTRFVAYAFSGYPTFEERIAKVEHAAQNMPSSQPSVYHVVELLNNARSVDTEAVTAAKAQQAQQSKPAAKVQTVREAERVLYLPETMVIH